MKKQGKKSNNWIAFAVAAVALISLVAIAYAQENTNKDHASDDMMDMMGGKGMGTMHKQMTKNLDPKLREQMDKMHEQCEKLHENGTFEKGMMQ